ncbi:MAG: hypothetical protein CHACPFDD_00342 [Phycisphaerae bacterium]|nr:hypothetical protein [Phycisphaerae bacterium]
MATTRSFIFGALLAVGVLAGASIARADTHCVDFDDLPTGDTYPCCAPAVFTSDGIRWNTHEFFWPANGIWFPGGWARTVAAGWGSPPNQLWTNNVNVEPNMNDIEGKLGGPVHVIEFDFRDWGGFTNIRVNGVFLTPDDLDMIPFGAVIGGIEFQIVAGHAVIIARTAPSISTFWVGGQELEIDNFCAHGHCLACDTNCDGSVNGFDIDPLVDLLSGGGSPCSPCAGDMNGDGSINGFDIDQFVEALKTGGCW